MKLSQRKCKPCEGGMPKFNKDEIEHYLKLLNPPWNVEDNTKIVKEFNFSNFIETMKFVNKVAVIAEEEEHHPVMHVYYSKVIVELWTHAILGLSENDFILAAKIDEIQL